MTSKDEHARRDAIQGAHGTLVSTALSTLREAKIAGPLRGALDLLEISLIDDDSRTQQRALAQLPALEAAMAHPKANDAFTEALVALLPVMRVSLAHREETRREQALQALRTCAFLRNGRPRKTFPAPLKAALTNTVEPIATCLEIESLIGTAARVLWEFSERGLSVLSVREHIETHLTHSTPGIRSALSRALSASLQHAKMERRLPKDAYHRRTYALKGDAVAPGGRPCRVCESRNTSTLYAFSDHGQTWATEITEIRCQDCGLYSVFAEGY